VVATFQGVDVEKIVASNADLVISGGAPFGQGPAVEQLRRANIPVLVVAPATLADVLENIQLIGSATGDSGAAANLVAAMTADFDAIRSATAGLDHPKVFYEIDATSKIFTAATGSLLEEMLKAAGADPITTGSPTAYDIAIETLVQADPSLILLGDAAYGVTADQVKGRPGWDTISAVKSGNIKAVDDIVITRPGPRLVEGLREAAGKASDWIVKYPQDPRGYYYRGLNLLNNRDVPGAAEQLRLPKSTVSRRLSGLEQRLGEKLLQRSTRRLTLTDFGQGVLESVGDARGAREVPT